LVRAPFVNEGDRGRFLEDPFAVGWESDGGGAAACEVDAPVSLELDARGAEFSASGDPNLVYAITSDLVRE
jgi:hypothetical protein